MRVFLGALFLLVLAGLTGSGHDISFQSLYDGRRWFELREAIQGKRVPPFYIGAVASAFNDVKRAEQYLKRAVEQGATGPDAERAHGLLAHLYARLGRSREVVRQFDEMLKIRPESPDVINVRALFAAFSKYPDTTLGRNRHSSFRCTANASGLVLPLSINGKAVRWALDTGINLSAVSESEAQMLGLTVQPVSAEAGDLAGGATTVRATVAGRMTFGTVEIENVPMLVMPDSQPPMNELPAGERGILGLPVAIAFQTMRWTTDGSFEIGAPPHSSRTARNLCFDGLTPLTQVQFEGRKLDFIFDTGNGAGTQLWERFSNDFAAMVKANGTKSSKRVTQIGGSHEREVVSLPELRLRIGGMDTALSPANVFAKPVGNEFQHGLLGMDLLSQAHAVSIDFRSMSVLLQ
jgi:predicted aspartyl protease